MLKNATGFDVLHVIRVRGFTDTPAIARALDSDLDTLEDQLTELTQSDLVEYRDLGKRAGWLLRPAGTAEHTRELALRRTPEFDAAVDAGYRRFLTANRPMKELCSDWQLADNAPDAADLVVEELVELSATAQSAAAMAGDFAPWFATYKPRLDEAVALFAGGDQRYLISPLVDSFHTVWAECHEDFLVSLGRERSGHDE